MSKVTLINHSSLLIQLDEHYFLTDPWVKSPAFGSWLPSAPPIYNVSYLAALSFQKNFSLVISHAHDDHIDDEILEHYFNKEARVIISKFSSPSLRKRLNRIGFYNLIELNDDINTADGFEYMQVFDATISNDDAGIAIRNNEYCVYHGNDNWFKLSVFNEKKLKLFAKDRKFLFASQTNSASGHPLSYPQFENEKNILTEKVKKMLVEGLLNAQKVKADYFLPYAGYATPFVKGMDYEKQSFSPTYANLSKLLGENNNLMVNLFCGGTINLYNGEISYPFNYEPNRVLEITNNYLIREKIVDKCDSFNESNDTLIVESDIKNYLLEFNDFVNSYLNRSPNFYKSILSKSLRIIVENKQEEQIELCIEIGSGNLLNQNSANKTFVIKDFLFEKVLNKKIPFENLYTGYQAKVYREPKNIYNRDIIMYLDMFGYKYMNS